MRLSAPRGLRQGLAVAVCGAGDLKIIAAILERPGIEKIRTHLGLDPQPPPRGRAREAGQSFAT